MCGWRPGKVGLGLVRPRRVGWMGLWGWRMRPGQASVPDAWRMMRRARQHRKRHSRAGRAAALDMVVAMAEADDRPGTGGGWRQGGCMSGRWARAIYTLSGHGAPPGISAWLQHAVAAHQPSAAGAPPCAVRRGNPTPGHTLPPCMVTRVRTVRPTAPPLPGCCSRRAGHAARRRPFPLPSRSSAVAGLSGCSTRPNTICRALPARATASRQARTTADVCRATATVGHPPALSASAHG